MSVGWGGAACGACEDGPGDNSKNAAESVMANSEHAVRMPTGAGKAAAQLRSPLKIVKNLQVYLIGTANRDIDGFFNRQNA